MSLSIKMAALHCFQFSTLYIQISVTFLFFVRFRSDLQQIAWFKAAYSVTLNIFRKNYFLFKSFVKVELSYVFTTKMFSTAENCMEK